MRGHFRFPSSFQADTFDAPSLVESLIVPLRAIVPRCSRGPRRGTSGISRGIGLPGPRTWRGGRRCSKGTGRVACNNTPLSGVVFASTQWKALALPIAHQHPLAAPHGLDEAALRGSARGRSHEGRAESECSEDWPSPRHHHGYAPGTTYHSVQLSTSSLRFQRVVRR